MGSMIGRLSIGFGVLVVQMLQLGRLRVRSFDRVGAANRAPRRPSPRRRIVMSASRAAEARRPDSAGRFGKFGGQYVPETLIQNLRELETAYREAKNDPSFKAQLDTVYKDYVGRPSPLYFAPRLSEYYKRQIYLKREDLNHTGAHKINNSLGQVLLCLRMGKKRIIAETGAGQHGCATAAACAKYGLECHVYMGSKDMERQKLNVFRMQLSGAEVIPVDAGTMTLKDATSEAIRDWITNIENTHYCIGSVCGPHPFPEMVRDFQSIIGLETRQQLQEKIGRGPDVLLACVGGGSNAMGLFNEFVGDSNVRLIGIEAAGKGVDSGLHAATLTQGTPGVLHGSFSMLLQDEEGQVIDPFSISAGLDYSGVGPEHSFLLESGRAEYHAVTDEEALQAFERLSQMEGIIPALETSHAFAYLETLCPTLPEDSVIVVNCSGRGDKDVDTAMKHFDYGFT